MTTNTQALHMKRSKMPKGAKGNEFRGPGPRKQKQGKQTPHEKRVTVEQPKKRGTRKGKHSGKWIVTSNLPTKKRGRKIRPT